MSSHLSSLSTPSTQHQPGRVKVLAAKGARYLLAFVFIVFGLNGFLHFIPQPPPTSDFAMQFFAVMFASHYLQVTFAVQVIGGVLFLFERTTPLAMIIIGPIIVNILLFHALMDPMGIVPGLVVTALWAVVFVRYFELFAPILTGPTRA